MKKNIQLVCLAAGFAMIISVNGVCRAAISTLDFDPAVLTNAGWPRLVGTPSNLVTACPELAGDYVLNGEAISLVWDDGRLSSTTRGRANSAFSFADNYRYGPSKILGDKAVEELPPSGLLRVLGSSISGFELRARSPKDPDVAIAGTITPQAGTFACTNGRIKQSRTGSGYSDGSQSATSVSEFLGLLEDGSLLYFSQTTNSKRSLFFLSTVRTVATYSRYPRVQKERD